MKKLKHFAGICVSWVFDVFRKVKEALLKLIFHFCPVVPNKIYFNNFNGRGFGCNPKYIAQEILSRDLGCDLVWIVGNMNDSFPEGIRKVPVNSIRSMYEVATAKVIVTNVKNDLRLLKKNSQYIIHTWHGSYSAKLIEREVEDKLSPKYVRESKEHSRITDLFLSNSRILSQRYRDSFWYSGEIMECGFPRNDILFNASRSEIANVYQKLGIPDTAKLVLYAPTFRDDGDTACYNIDCNGILNALEHNGDKWYLLIRLHPNISDAGGLFPFNTHIVDATKYPDMQELLLASHILITDYSSSIFEFAVMGKPSYIYASDVEQYQQTRGVHEEFFHMPYPVHRTNSELIAQLKAYSPEIGKKLASLFMEKYGSTDNGTASAQVTDRIISVINGTFTKSPTN